MKKPNRDIITFAYGWNEVKAITLDVDSKTIIHNIHGVMPSGKIDYMHRRPNGNMVYYSTTGFISEYNTSAELLYETPVYASGLNSLTFDLSDKLIETVYGTFFSTELSRTVIGKFNVTVDAEFTPQLLSDVETDVDLSNFNLNDVGFVTDILGARQWLFIANFEAAYHMIATNITTGVSQIIPLPADFMAATTLLLNVAANDMVHSRGNIIQTENNILLIAKKTTSGEIGFWSAPKDTLEWKPFVNLFSMATGFSQPQCYSLTVKGDMVETMLLWESNPQIHRFVVIDTTTQVATEKIFSPLLSGGQDFYMDGLKYSLRGFDLTKFHRLSSGKFLVVTCLVQDRTTEGLILLNETLTEVEDVVFIVKQRLSGLHPTMLYSSPVYEIRGTVQNNADISREFNIALIGKDGREKVTLTTENKEFCVMCLDNAPKSLVAINPETGDANAVSKTTPIPLA